ncbi:MAG: MFS transporter, partial [Roseateles sp.]
PCPGAGVRRPLARVGGGKGALEWRRTGQAGNGAEGSGTRRAAARLGQALSPWLFGLLLDGLGAGALWCSAGLALSALAALLLIRLRPPS